jgi:hypothetical protein
MSSQFFDSFTFRVDSKGSDSDGSRVGLIVGVVCGALLLAALAVLLIGLLRRSRIESYTVQEEGPEDSSFEMAVDVSHTFISPFDTAAAATFADIGNIFAYNADEGTPWQ